MCPLCSKARSAARRAQDEADALKAEAKELKQKADELLQNLRAAEDDVSKLCCPLFFFASTVISQATHVCISRAFCVSKSSVLHTYVFHLCICINNTYVHC